MSGEREVRIKFTGDSAVLKGSAGDVRKIFQNLIADEDDARGAGEKLADAQKQVADNMRKSMAEISAAADVLADSLGPEMVQAIEQTGRTVEDEVQRFQKLGLTLDDVKRDSDLLAAGMKDLDDASRMSTGAVGDGFRKVAGEVDNTRGVVANFTGNLASELPGVTGAFGPLNMAIGQFAEYATEGNITFKNFLTAAGGIGAATVGFQLLSTAITALGADQREMNARTDEVVDALEDQIVKSYDLATASGVASGEVDGLAAAQSALSNALLAAGDDGDKLRLSLGAIGLTGEEALATLVKLKTDPVAALRALAEQAGYTGAEAERMAQQVASTDKLFLGASEANLGLTEDMKQTMIAMEELQDQAEKTDLQKITQEFLNNQAAANDASTQLVRLAEELAGVSRNDDALKVWEQFNILLGEADAATRDAVLGTHEYQDALRASEAALQDQEEAQRSATEATAAAEQAIRDVMSAQLASIDAGYAAADAQDQFITAMEAARTATNDTTTGVDEYEQAQRNAAQAAMAMALANQANAEKMALANGAPLDAAASTKVYTDSLYMLAMSLDENSPVRAALLDHLALLQGAPATVATKVDVDVTDAHERIGGVQTKVDELDKSEPNTKTSADTDATKTALDELLTRVAKLEEGVTIPAGFPPGDVNSMISDCDRMVNALQRVIDRGNEADRVVARVAG